MMNYYGFEQNFYYRHLSIALLTQNEFDNKTQILHNLPGVDISVKDFGRKGSVDYVVKNQAKYNYKDNNSPNSIFTFFDNFRSMSKYYEDREYEIGKDLFVAPYDWRIAPLFVDDYWIQLRQLFEKAYNHSNGQKVTILGFSMGCFMIQQFLASEKILKNNQGKTIDGRQIWTSIKKTVIDEKWKDKYIEKAIFFAPSFGGTFKAFDGMIRRFSPLIAFFSTEYIADMSTSIPAFYSHWPIYHIFKGYVAARGPDGQNYTTELRDLCRSKTFA